MKNLLRDLRILPIVLIATVSLFGLKMMGLLFEGGYTTTTERPVEAPVRNAANAAPEQAVAQRGSWAQEMFGFPNDQPGAPKSQPSTGPSNAVAQNPLAALDITGSVGATKEPAAAPKSLPTTAKAAQQPSPGAIPLDQRATSPAERAILERLQERRGELDTREREIELRESLLKATEKRLEDRVGELKTIEARINETLQKKDEAEVARFKSLVSMYENMKAKEAARIFDRLDLKVLLDVSSQINPRRMSDILAQMMPDAAERLTVELANRFNGNKTAGAAPAATLPKIEGRAK